MINPDDAQEIMGDHFKQITLDEFNILQDAYVGKGKAELVPIANRIESQGRILYQREAAPLKLNAYLASALTGLDEIQRVSLLAVSDIVSKVCSGLAIDLYQPINATDPESHPRVSPEDVYNLDRERVSSSDLLIHVADYASTGAGEELDIAQSALVPIVVINHGSARVSRMVTGIPALKLEITYGSLEELRLELQQRLTEIRPILEERKLTFSDFEKNMVGNKVRVSREDANLTREEVAAHSNELLTPERIRAIESTSDKVSNPSLMELRTLATVLKTTVADLVEPDLDERMIALLQEWMLGKVEARSAMSERDNRRILRHMLHAVIIRLDSE